MFAAATPVGLTQALGSSGVCEKQLRVAYWLNRPICASGVVPRELAISAMRVSGLHFSLHCRVGHAHRYRRTAQPRSPSRRSGGKVGKLAHPSPTQSHPACARSLGLQAAMWQTRLTRSVAALRPLALAPHAFRRRVRLLWRRRWQSRPLSPNNSSKPTQLRGGNMLRLVRSYLPPLRRSA